MRRLLDKYKRDKLTPDELLELRRRSQRLGEEELERLLMEDWIAFQREEVVGLPIGYERMRQRIERRIGRSERRSERRSWMVRCLRYAAIMLVPLLLASTFYFYRKAEVVSGQEMVISAGIGERANVTLPDGTSVKINAESTLRYSPAEFNKSTREIHIDGEAFFEVHRNPDIPFIVSSQNLSLKVLGTTFNFRSRKEEEQIEVTLLEGHVLLSSATHARKQQELMGKEKAIFYKNTGEFRVERESREEDAIAWTREKLIFKNTLFKDLITTVERAYGVTFEFSGCERFMNDSFSGTLPSTNLEMALEILRKSYGFRYSVSADKISVTCE